MNEESRPKAALPHRAPKDSDPSDDFRIFVGKGSASGGRGGRPQEAGPGPDDDRPEARARPPRVPVRRWWEDPGSLSDEQLLRVARSMLAVDRAVDGYRRKRHAA